MEAEDKCLSKIKKVFIITKCVHKIMENYSIGNTMKEEFNPLVSIVIPVYNGAEYMREAIDSALAQTYKNIEVIVVNDGSKDNTDEIARSYGEKIRYFKKENGGVSTALNLGIQNMQGEYFSWLSHDDVYLPEKIERQIDILGKIDDKTTVIYGGWKTIDNESNVTCEYALDTIYDDRSINNGIFVLANRLVSGCSVLISKKILSKFNGFDENLRTTQDYDLWFKIFRSTKIMYDKACNTLSREHEQQVSRTSSIHGEECDALWIQFFESLTDNDIKEAYDSVLLFYENMTAKFVDEWFYNGAVDYVYKKYQMIYKTSILTKDRIFIHTLLEKFYNAKLYIKNKTSLYKQLLLRFQKRPIIIFIIKSLYRLKKGSKK